jgi:hypothetical protein
MPWARPLTAAEWEAFDYRAFMTRGDAYVEENFDIHAGNWRQDPGQPLFCLVLGSAEPSSGLVPAEYKLRRSPECNAAPQPRDVDRAQCERLNENVVRPTAARPRTASLIR